MLLIHEAAVNYAGHLSLVHMREKEVTRKQPSDSRGQIECADFQSDTPTAACRVLKPLGRK